VLGAVHVPSARILVSHADGEFAHPLDPGPDLVTGTHWPDALSRARQSGVARMGV